MFISIHLTRNGFCFTCVHRNHSCNVGYTIKGTNY